MSLVSPIIPTRAALQHAAEGGPVHWRPVWSAVRDGSCNFAMVRQGRLPFRLAPSRLPLVLYIGDDMAEALGPEGFHRRSLRRVIETCQGAVVVACEPKPQLYAMAATTAVLDRANVVLVETRAEQEIPWIEFLRECRQDIGLAIGSVVAGSA